MKTTPEITNQTVKAQQKKTREANTTKKGPTTIENKSEY